MAEIKSKDLAIGKIYRMVHSRKGTAKVKCLEPSRDGGTFEVVEGELRGINDYYGVGYTITTINNIARFYDK